METPEFISHIGRGRFSRSDSTMESSFVLSRTPYWTSIVAEMEIHSMALRLFFEQDTIPPIQLSGTLNDGRQIQASILQKKTQLNEGHLIVEFIPSKSVSLGQGRDTPPTESRYPLIGYLDGKFTLVHDGWYINSIPCLNPEAAQELVEKWRYPAEGMTLQLKRDDAATDQHLDFARIVMILLSLASGTSVSCRRQFFTWDNEALEIWRRMEGNGIGPGPIVPEFEIKGFLEQALRAWQALSVSQQKALRLAVDHINLSEVGYLDERLFHVFLPWEFLAKAWGKQGVLDDSVTCLRDRLHQTHRQWIKEHPGSKSDGLWGNRISSIFGWPKAKDAIEKLTDHFGLNLKKVGLDLKSLKDARDDVAHSGKLSEELSKTGEQALTLLTTSRYYLQLLLLRMLSYQGLVYHATNKSQTIEKIDQAIITTYNQNVSQ